MAAVAGGRAKKKEEEAMIPAWYDEIVEISGGGYHHRQVGIDPSFEAYPKCMVLPAATSFPRSSSAMLSSRSKPPSSRCARTP